MYSISLHIMSKTASRRQMALCPATGSYRPRTIRENHTSIVPRESREMPGGVTLLGLLLDDSCLDPSLIAPAWLPFPILLLLNQVSIVGRHSSDASCSRRHSAITLIATDRGGRTWYCVPAPHSVCQQD